MLGIVRNSRPFILCILALAAAAACRGSRGNTGPQIVQPGAPGQPTRVITAETAVDLAPVKYTPADVQFMQGMIGHHAQAVEMTDMLATRTESDEMRKLAERIAVSQDDEIKMMQEWLKRRGETLPDPHAHHHGGRLMPGMLTAEDMTKLSEARGAAFDRLFLEFMIKHHEGALVMVQELFATPAAGQEPEMFAFANDVDADQRAEIDRMHIILDRLKEHSK
jgi:uncharacterized protein (DUF305 family)